MPIVLWLVYLNILIINIIISFIVVMDLATESKVVLQNIFLLMQYFKLAIDYKSTILAVTADTTKVVVLRRADIFIEFWLFEFHPSIPEKQI